MFRLQCIRQAPAHDLVRVGVRHQVQVAAVVHQVDVRDVAHPQLVRPRRHESADEVLVLAVAMVLVRCVTRLTGIDLDEPLCIPSDRPARWMMLGVAMAILECGTESLDTIAMLRGLEMSRIEK